MKLRKVMAWTLASAMFAGLLAGCGGSTASSSEAPRQQRQQRLNLEAKRAAARLRAARCFAIRQALW